MGVLLAHLAVAVVVPVTKEVDHAHLVRVMVRVRVEMTGLRLTSP